MPPQLRYARTSGDVTIAYAVDGQREPTLVWMPPAPFSDVLAQYGIPLLRDISLEWAGPRSNPAGSDRGS